MTEQTGCVFCDIVAGKAKAYKIYGGIRGKVYLIKSN